MNPHIWRTCCTTITSFYVLQKNIFFIYVVGILYRNIVSIYSFKDDDEEPEESEIEIIDDDDSDDNDSEDDKNSGDDEDDDENEDSEGTSDEEEEEVEEEQVFSVEKILKHRVIRGQVQYHIKWIGYEEKTWGIASDFFDKAPLEAFINSKGSDSVTEFEKIQIDLASKK